MAKPSDLQRLGAYTEKIAPKGGGDAQQVICTATLPGGRLQDLSGDVKYEIADPKIARVSTTGRVTPLANGKTELTASYGTRSAKIPLSAEAVDQNLPINFGNQIVPI